MCVCVCARARVYTYTHTHIHTHTINKKVLEESISVEFASVTDIAQQGISSGGITNYMAMAENKYYDIRTA